MVRDHIADRGPPVSPSRRPPPGGDGAAAGPPRLADRWPADPRSVGLARHAVTRFAARAGARVDVQHHVALAVSEAIANAVVHAYRDGRGRGHISVEAHADGGFLDVVVSDDGTGLAPRPDSPGLGVGLSLIASFTDHLDIGRPKDGGTRLCMRFALA
jgi:serine/threonine-protein kinase RsbW/stage II sporulation protein AB (anti-sigma F factor)